MKANELRIWNLIYCNEKIVKINSEVLYQGVESESFKPIPLTEEWLLRFGYKQTSKDFFDDETRLNVWREPKNFNGFLADWADKTIGEVKYVHQLQNLYFALTGTDFAYETLT